MKRIPKTCQAYFDLAAVELADNPHLAPYLIGLAHAWRITGHISLATCHGMETAARALRDAGKEVGA